MELRLSLMLELMVDILILGTLINLLILGIRLSLLLYLLEVIEYFS